MQLRDYQERLIDDARDALRRHHSALIQSPTGSGKTAILVHMMKVAASRGRSSFFCVHQSELLNQTSKALWAQKLEHGQIAAGRVQSRLPVQVASVQTLVRRTSRYSAPDLIIIDEAHRAAASTYRRILDAYPSSRVIGLTATPERTDGKGLSDIFDTIVHGPSVNELIQRGYLSDYEIFAPPSQVDISGIKTTAGDYNKAELQAAIDKPTITGDAVSHYIKHAYGKRCVVMCVSIDHAKHVVEQYRAQGVPAEHIDGSMTDAQREAALARFESGQTLIMANVQLLIEGVDIPAIEAVQWLRPTQSLIVWMQGCGRGLRPHPGKEKLLIFDHVGNWTRHGLPDDEREWSLEGRKARKRKASEADEGVKIVQCKGCFHVFRAGPPNCPRCGKAVEINTAREIEQIDGELAKIDLDAERKQRKREQASARSLRELIEIGIRRGMNSPAEWAAIVMAARKRGKPTGKDFAVARELHLEMIRNEPRNSNSATNNASPF